MRCSESKERGKREASKRETYSINPYVKKEKKKISNQQSNFTPKGVRKKIN